MVIGRSGLSVESRDSMRSVHRWPCPMRSGVTPAKRLRGRASLVGALFAENCLPFWAVNYYSPLGDSFGDHDTYRSSCPARVQDRLPARYWSVVYGLRFPILALFSPRSMMLSLSSIVAGKINKGSSSPWMHRLKHYHHHHQS